MRTPLPRSVIKTDRELLLTLKIQLDTIADNIIGISNRISKIEGSHITEDRMGRVESSLHDLQRDKLDKAVFDKSDASAFDVRLRTIENFKSWILGIIVGTSGLTSIITGLIVKFAGGK